MTGPLRVATHSGPFHADDVMAVGLVRVFLDPDARVVRSRDPKDWDAADVVVDVGGIFDPDKGRFNHHQHSYEGPLSSAGMVLEYLEAAGHVSEGLAHLLRKGLVDYLDDVDNGRRAPDAAVPCFPRMVDALNQPARTSADFDEAFGRAVGIARDVLQGMVAGHERVAEAHLAVTSAMQSAAEAGLNVLFLDEYYNWKPVYFDNGGQTHPTEYVLFPGTDGTWRVVAIPPKLGDFAQKRSLPEAWAGLTGDELVAASGVPGAVFCHKNRFIAVFQERDQALTALERTGRLHRDAR